jgi:hypothetical protein
MRKNDLTKEEIEKHLYYKDGKLFWKKSRCCNKFKKDSEAGTITSSGYRTVSINKKQTRSHRLIYILHFGYAPSMLDHINKKHP